jgi:hypothetical protein
MSDVNAFVEAVGKDVVAVAVPRIDALAARIADTVQAQYGPRVAAFASALAKDIIDDQTANIRDFVASLVEELCRRYQPDMRGELHARLTQGGLDLTGHGVTLDLKRRDDGATVASLDIPIALHVRVEDVAVTLRDTIIKLDVVK